MEITYPFAKVFIDSTNKQNIFFCHDTEHTTFEQIGEIGCGIVDFCELDFTPVADKIKAPETTEVTDANFETVKQIYWDAVDLLKDKHGYAHFFLNGDLVRNFYVSDRPKAEQISYAAFLFQYYMNLQKDYSEALEVCLSNEVLPQYTLPERYLMFCNLKPAFKEHMLRSMYGIAPVANGKFDTSKLVAFDNPEDVNSKKVLQNIHRDSDHPVSMWQYFAIQSLEEMLYLELMEMVKRGIRIKRCGLCDRYFVLADKRKRDYCDRIYKGNRTCKQVGAKQRFNKDVGDDTNLQEFLRIYNRMYSRFYRMDAWDSNRQTNKLSKDEFMTWTELASNARLAYKQGEISGEEMIQRISQDAE